MGNEIKSFRDAFRGIFVLFAKEPHARIHLYVAALVIGAGFYFHVSNIEWILLLFAIALVITAEALNTSIEKLCDVAHPEKSERIRDIKDIAAGAVLMCAIFAVIIGVLIFYPHIF